MASASHEQRIDWGDDVHSHVADFEAAKRTASDTITALVDQLKATDVIICLSDDFDNWRNDIYPAYKTHRAKSVRPEHLYDMKDWLADTYATDRRNRLEADDVMGILSTEPHDGERIIVSADKDMQTVPGLLFNPNKDKRPRRITPEQAERFLLWQTICGDQTDGYPGCPGAGPQAAEHLLAGRGWKPFTHTFLRGPRKGTEEKRWKPAEGLDPWRAIVSAYEKAGLTEADAVVQYNLARILKHGEWDGKRVILWTPPAAH